MKATDTYDLRLYEASDQPNLITGYNHSITQIDNALSDLQAQINVRPQILGLAAFTTALGLNETNATQLGETLNHLLNKVKAAGFTVNDLANAEITSEGHIYIPTTTKNNN